MIFPVDIAKLLKLNRVACRPLVVETRDDWKLSVLTYPAEPRPATVESRFGEERYPAVRNAFVVEIKEDVKDAVERYPLDPKPVTVDVRFAILLIPKAVENEEKERETKLDIEMREDVKDTLLIYPADPKPVTVDCKLTTLVAP